MRLSVGCRYSKALEFVWGLGFGLQDLVFRIFGSGGERLKVGFKHWGLGL